MSIVVKGGLCDMAVAILHTLKYINHDNNNVDKDKAMAAT
jgi:hypothetical protein